MDTITKISKNSGFTILEIAIALSIAFVVLMALGKLIIVNQNSLSQALDKVTLQQNLALSLDRMTRSIRRANRIEVVSPQEFRTYDKSGLQLASYHLETGAANEGRIQLNGSGMSPFNCTEFTCLANDDTTGLTLTLELSTSEATSTRGQTSATIRNRTFGF